MKTSAQRVVVAGVLSALGACLAVVDEPASDHVEGDSALFDVRGGSLRTLRGVELAVPPGTVAAPTRFTISSGGAPALPGGWVVAGPAAIFEPEGARFAKAVRLSLPLYEAAAERTVRVATAPQGSAQFELLHAAREGDRAIVVVSHFSVFVPVVVPADGGEEQAPDAAGVPDASVATPDGGGCPGDTDAGAVPFYGVGSTLPCFSKSGSRAGDSFYLTCTATECRCEKNPGRPGATTTTFAPPADVCQEAGFKRAWTCACEFPPLEKPTTCTPLDGGTPAPGTLGAPCKQSSDCESGQCWNTTGTPKCAVTCDPFPLAEKCPCGYLCSSFGGVGSSIDLCVGK